MTNSTRLFLAFLICLGCCSAALSQNLATSFQNPDGLYVCGTDQLSVTLTNSAGSAVTGVRSTIILPAGITYVVGSATGATEFNVANPNAPVFNVADVAIGGSRTITITVKASCALLGEINSGKLFSLQTNTNYAGGSSPGTSSLFKVETGLLIITSVVPFAVTGQQGDMVTRNITVKNTREGPISSLSINDVHQAGITIDLVGVGGTNVTTQLFQANVPGSIFTTVGDGDALLENGEELVLIEKITITKCSPNLTSISSLITAGWGCDASVCQQDSAYAEVQILPTTKNPKLKFFPKYSPPRDYCGDAPSIQELTIVNEGEAETNSLTLLLFSQDTFHLGIDASSFEINTGSGWMPVAPGNGKTRVLQPCGKTFNQVTSNLFPGLAVGDTMRVRYKTYFCAPECYDEISFLSAAYSYPKACPTTQFISGNFNFFPKVEDVFVDAKVEYDFGGCMEPGNTYDLTYWIKSRRQTQDTGFLHVYFDLPWGLEWTGDCDPILDGKSPLSTEVTAFPGSVTKVKLVYKLPFSKDSVASDFCVRYLCVTDPACSTEIPNPPPPGGDYTVFPPPLGCEGCDFVTNVTSGFATSATTARECIVSVCDRYTMVGNLADCPGGGGGGGGGGGLAIASASFNTFRINVGLQDDNDDRKADSKLLTTNSNVRLDRFLVGDTMRTQLRVAVLLGQFETVAFRLFNESWQSDFGIDGGDSYQILAGKRLFVNKDTLFYMKGSVKFKIAATGAEYTCPVDKPSLQSDQHIFTIAAANIRPLQTEDVLSSMFDEFEFSMDALASTGCVPPGLVLGLGDSLIFEGDYKFEHNFLPAAGNQPPLVNFRNTICDLDAVYAWKLDNCFPPLMRQFSGYVERMRAPQFKIFPCDSAEQVSPFEYRIKIAKPNLFPFEVRPLAALTSFSHSLPGVVPLLDKRLTFLRLQDDVPVLSNVQLDLSSANIDFNPYFPDPLDEGWNLQTDFQFGNNCNLNGNVLAQTSVGVRYWSECFHKPNPDVISIINPNGYVDARPKLRLVPEDSLLYLPENQIDLDFHIKNNFDALGPNGWVVIDDAGALTDVELVFLPSGQPVPSIGGVYQVGQFLGFEQKDFRLKATNVSCDVVNLRLRYGWDCSPMTNPASDVCGDLVKIIKIRPQRPELELIVKNQPTEIPLCAPSAYFEFEVYNANEGTASDVLASVKLPSGLKVIPNSAQIAYPTGSGWIPLPNPTLTNGISQWTPEAVVAALAAKGLVGVSQSPDNSFSIRFKVEASCGFVSNSQIVYGSEAVQPCGALSNVLRKPGPPVSLAGVSPSYLVQSQLSFTTPPGAASCGQAVSLTATLIMGDAPNPGDSIYILLPAGTSYVSGSYQSVQGGPAGPPQVKGQTLQLPMPGSAGIGSVVKFKFEVRYDDPASCDDKIISLQTREREGAFCPSQNVNCNVYVATGESLLTLNTQNPDLLLKNFEPVAAGNGFTFKALLENAGAGPAQNEVVKFYLDQNGNGKVDAGEPLVTEAKFSQLIAAGNSAPIAGPLGNLSAADICKLIAVVPGADNCACSDRTFPLGGSPVISTAVASCTVQALTFGPENQTGHTYEWTTPGGLSCTNCSSTTFTPGPSVKPGDVLTFVLLDRVGNCTTERRFEVQYGAPGGLETPDQTICKGESVTLTASAGGTYQWSGPGITTSSAAQQVLNPTATATYKVTVTYPGGCTGTGQSLVTVLPSDTLKLADKKTCKGSPLDIFGTLTDVTGTYTRTLSNSNGCDSVLVQRLFVSPTEGTESRAICPGDTTIVFGEKVGKAGNYCKTFMSTAGCDSLHCVVVKSVPNPMLTQPDTITIAKGSSTVLNGPPNMVEYLWTPGIGLSCNNCQNPTAMPDTSTTYTLKVRDGNGCEGGVVQRVRVFPPCDPGKLPIPNAFTPNGDQVNDMFRVVPYEGFEEVLSLQVYDRWGRKVFEKTGTGALEWDGMVDGKIGQADVYAYIILVNCPSQGRVVREGDVTLLR